MKKYRVTVVEHCSYHVDVEAESEEAARETAIEVIVQSADRDKMFFDCMERDTANVWEDPPNWKADV